MKCSRSSVTCATSVIEIAACDDSAVVNLSCSISERTLDGASVLLFSYILQFVSCQRAVLLVSSNLTLAVQPSPNSDNSNDHSAITAMTALYIQSTVAQVCIG
jgi:hypothetical protein